MSIKDQSPIFNSAKVDPENCVFCRIVSRQLASLIVYEDKDYIAFLDKAPFTEGHTLVCPKKHGETVWDMTEAEIGGLFMIASKVSRAVVAAMRADGFRFVQNNGEAANQVVAHVHVHTIPVKMADKGRWMDRKNLSAEEMTKIAKKIKENM